MNHEALRGRLVDLALGLLPPAEAREVEAHAAGCAGCAAELAGLRGARAAMAGLPPLPAPERGEAVLLAAARQAAEASAAPRRAGLPRWLWGAALGAASAAVALLLTIRLAGSPPPSRLDDRREPEPAPLAAAPREVAQPAPEEAPPPVAKATATRPRPATKGAGAAPRPEPEAAPRSLPVGEAKAAALAASPPRPPPRPPPPPAAARAKALAEDWAPAPAAHAEHLVFPGCPGERSRTLTRDGAGRLVRRQRLGALGGTEYSAEESFGEDGRLLGAVVRLGGRELVLDGAALARDGLEPVPGLRLAPTAAAAEAEPARCGP